MEININNWYLKNSLNHKIPKSLDSFDSEVHAETESRYNVSVALVDYG